MTYVMIHQTWMELTKRSGVSNLDMQVFGQP
jgi:hypothetical protein